MKSILTRYSFTIALGAYISTVYDANAGMPHDPLSRTAGQAQHSEKRVRAASAFVQQAEERPRIPSLVALGPGSKFSVCRLENEHNEPIRPMALLPVKHDLYFLGPDCMWIGRRGNDNLGSSNVIRAERIKPPPRLLKEFNNFVYLNGQNSLVVLDKSGDLVEFNVHSQQWRPYWTNIPFNIPLTGQPDPDFIDICAIQHTIYLLDPERNQLWSCDCYHHTVRPCFKEVLPWKMKRGDQNFSQSLAIASDGREIFAVNRGGCLTTYSGIRSYLHSTGSLKFNRLTNMRPSRLVIAPGTPVYIVERENNRIVAIDNGKSSQFLFPAGSDLRGLMPRPGGFWIIDGNKLVYRNLDNPDSFQKSFQPRSIDSRLKRMILPLAHVSLPRHPGVYPGARRLYRYGVHAGMDFFNDPGSKSKIVMGTPVQAADSGRIIRLDARFMDMDSFKLAKVLKECAREHRSSPRNEDLFRGRQVWIDHGHGLITRYAHLSKVHTYLKEGQYISRGNVIGCVGVSGTGQHLKGRVKYPHLHFEIWLDDKYLGWGLSPAETIRLYEKMFGGS